MFVLPTAVWYSRRPLRGIGFVLAYSGDVVSKMFEGNYDVCSAYSGFVFSMTIENTTPLYASTITISPFYGHRKK